MILYRCPSVRSNRVVTMESENGYLMEALCKTGFMWFHNEENAIEYNRIKRNKLIARKAREIQKLSEVY